MYFEANNSSQLIKMLVALQSISLRPRQVLAVDAQTSQIVVTFRWTLEKRLVSEKGLSHLSCVFEDFFPGELDGLPIQTI